MVKTSFIFAIDTPADSGWGSLYISNGTYREPGRVLKEYELVFVRKGRLRVEELDQSYDVNPGQSLILQPGVHHMCREMGSEHLQQYWARFTCVEASESSDVPRIVVPKLATVVNPDRMLLLWQMYTTERNELPLGRATRALIVTLLLREVARSSEGSDTSQENLIVLAAQARAFIQEHYHEPISRASISQVLDCNPNYLGRAFSKAYSKTITEYIYDVRMYHAREALAYGRNSVGEIARICGFGDRCHFRQVFAKRHGMSPLAYRKRNGHPDTNL